METANQRIRQWQQRGDTSISLDLSNLNLTNLPPLPNGLQILYCGNNQLTKITPSSRRKPWDLSDSSLPDLPNTLQILYCGNNQLTSLPTLPTSLQKLYCNINQLINLPTLPNTLQELDCYINKLTSLPDLPINLQKLNCRDNKLNNLPPLPNSLQTLICRDNKLTSLPTLPNSLKELYCEDNKLTNLPTLPNTLRELYCGDNKLTSLPDLPNSLQYLNYSNNSNLILTLEQREFIRNLNDNEPMDEELDEPLEETPYELQNRTNLAHTSMNQITSQNSRLIQSTLVDTTDDQKLNDLSLPELDAKEQAVYKSRCSNTNDLIGDDLDTRYGDVVIIDISNPYKYTTYCFTYPEADVMWDYAKTYNVHPYLGYKIYQRGILLSKLYNTLVLRRIEGIKYTLDPIPRRIFLREEEITPTRIRNFQPSLDDINQYYLNGKEEENTIKLETNGNKYKITGKFGSIEVNKSTNTIKNIVKISDSVSYVINGNSINRI